MGDRGAARKIAAALDVHPDTVRRWKRGARPTLNPQLVQHYRRSKLSDKREARIRSGSFTFTATIKASGKTKKQTMNLGEVMEAKGRDVGDELADAWLEGRDVAEVFQDLVDEYSGGIGMELVSYDSYEL